MKLELKTYKNDRKTVAKTYKATSFDLSFGTTTDLLKGIDIEKIDIDDTKTLAMLILSKWDCIVPTFMDIFPGISEDELRTCKTSDMVAVVKGAFIHLTESLNGLSDSKN